MLKCTKFSFRCFYSINNNYKNIGNEWYENTERRQALASTHSLLYMGMGVSGGEEGARYGPSLMPGGPPEAYERVKHILLKIAAVTKDGTVCCMHIGCGGAGNYIKMIHNGIEYGDMQLIAEAYDVLKNIAGLTNDELAQVFNCIHFCAKLIFIYLQFICY